MGDEQKEQVIWDTYDEPRVYSGARMYTLGDELHIEHTAAMNSEEMDHYHIKSDAAHYAEMLRCLRTTGKAKLKGESECEYDMLSLESEGDRVRLNFEAGGFFGPSPHASIFSVPLSYFKELQPASGPS